jgi:hypothetical protein
MRKVVSSLRVLRRGDRTPTMRWCGRYRGYRREFEVACRRTTSPLYCLRNRLRQYFKTIGKELNVELLLIVHSFAELHLEYTICDRRS